MFLNRRNFIYKIGGAAGAMTFSSFLPKEINDSLALAKRKISNLSSEDIAKAEEFWYQVRQAYTVSPGVINLNNAAVSPAPKVVQEAVDRYNKYMNEAPSYYMWRILDLGREPLRYNLARLAGCDQEEIAISRNATESLCNIIFGLTLEKGDEVILSRQDYPKMISAWRQRERRDGIVLKWVDLKLPSESKQSLIEAYTEKFTPNTKVVHLTHVINWNGQIIPVKDIATIAKDKNIQVLVDGAHSFAQINFKIPDLNCDYFGTSLHKWLGAPVGTGMLYVRKDKIKEIYPLMSADKDVENDIRKFESLGTRSFPIEHGIAQAINFHEYIGIERKRARLNYLKKYIVESLQGVDGVQIKSPISEEFGTAICLLSVKGKPSKEAHNFLFQPNERIHCSISSIDGLDGLRVTPNVYTLLPELDRFVSVFKSFATKD